MNAKKIHEILKIIIVINQLIGIKWTEIVYVLKSRREAVSELSSVSDAVISWGDMSRVLLVAG